MHDPLTKVKPAALCVLLSMVLTTSCRSADPAAEPTSVDATITTTGGPLEDDRPTLYELPRDGLAEVSRYQVDKSHYGVPTSGRLTMLVVRENLDAESYVKSNKTNAVPAVKIMLMRDIPSMNWDHRDNVAMYATANLVPLKLGITSEEWCGNNFLELRNHDGEVDLIGRPYTDDVAPFTGSAGLTRGAYFYEQMPVLARSALDQKDPTTITIVGPQTAYLNPHTDTFDVTIRRVGSEEISTPGYTGEVVVVDVQAASPSKHFPEAERYMLHPKSGVIVKAERNLAETERGKHHVGRIVWTLLDSRRMPYWDTPAPPETASRADRERATHSSYMGLNIRRAFAGDGSFNLEGFQKSLKTVPAEYLSTEDPGGNNQVVKTRDGKGGWFFDESGAVGERKGIFRPNVAAP